MQQKHIHNLHKGIHALHFSFTAGLLLLSAGLVAVYTLAPALLVRAGSGNAPFASGSVWNTALPRYPQLAGNSAAVVQDIVNQTSSYGAQTDTTDKGAPVYVVDPSTPASSVTPWGCDGPADTSLSSQWSSVPIPFYAQPSSGASGRMLVSQPSTGSVWEFSHMYKAGGQWFACHGGQITNTSINSGVLPSPYGVTGSGLALLGGQISVADIQRGRIDHVIGLALPQTGSSVSWPAVRSSGSGGTAPMGMRLQLDPSIDVNALGLSTYGRMVARAAQTYGFVVWDTASKVAVLGENPLSYTTRGAPNPYGSTSLAGFPWDKLQALPSNYGLSNHLPSLSQFDVSAANIAAGQSVKLTWQAINISECAIPGVASHLGPSGSVDTTPISSSTVFTVSCSGPNGSVSRSLNVTVPTGDQALPPPPPQAVNITNPVGGNAQVVAQLFDPSVLETVYKVAFYERGNLLQVTTKTPFALETEPIADGKHTLEARIFFRDGSDETQSISVNILNHPASLLIPRPLSKTTPTQSMVPLMVAGMVCSLSVMFASGYWGWRKGHPGY